MKLWRKGLAAMSALVFVGMALPASPASDWEEERSVFQVPVRGRAAQQGTPQAAQFDAPRPAPPIKRQGNAPLQGSAERSAFAAPPMQAQTGFGAPLQGGAQTNAWSQPGRLRAIDPMQAAADADRFLMQANTDQEIPPQMLRGWLDRTHPDFRLLASRSPGAVVEVKGEWDNAAEVLNFMGVPHQRIKAKQLRDFPLSGVKVMVINCEGRVPREAFERLRQWVIRGGNLITTDWALHSFVEKAFPGMVAWNGKHTDGSVVDASLLDADPDLFKGIPASRATWKLDPESQMIKVLKPEAVRVLARSYKLAERDPNRRHGIDHAGILAAEFSYGRGHVLHLVGHFDYNSPILRKMVLPDAIPRTGIGPRQAIATNFLVRALKAPAPAVTAEADLQ